MGSGAGVGGFRTTLNVSFVGERFGSWISCVKSGGFRTTLRASFGGAGRGLRGQLMRSRTGIGGFRTALNVSFGGERFGSWISCVKSGGFRTTLRASFGGAGRGLRGQLMRSRTGIGGFRTTLNVSFGELDQLRSERGMSAMTRSTWARMSSKTASAERRASTIWKS